MFKKHQQMSFADIYSACKDLFQNDKPQFLQLLEQYFDLSELVPLSFHHAYYNHLGRHREYSLYSMLSALILQKILGIPTVSLLIIVLTLSKELRDFCGFDKVPDHSQFTRFKQDFVDELETFFNKLVDITEPICQKLDEQLASILIFDTSGIEAYVAENNPKYINSLIKKLKRYYKDDPDVDVYKMAYGLMPSSAAVNDEIKQLYINGHFCYVYKFGILTNGLGIVRNIAFLDEDFKAKHPEVIVDKKTDSPDEDKSIGDSTALKPILKDYFDLHPDALHDIFLGDSAFDSYKTYPFLLKDCGFKKALIPLNPRNSNSSLPQPGYNEFGWPLCPLDSSKPMIPNGHCYGNGRSPRDKWVCPETHFENGKRVCHCENPCTSSPYGRVVYTYPDQNLRAYPGIIRYTKEWEVLYKKRAIVEQTVNYFKEPMGIGNPKTRDKKTIKADLLLAGITQLVTVILADKIDKHKYIRSLRPLVA